MKHTIGVDVGSTKISFVVLDGERIVSRQKILTPKNTKEIIKAIEENINKLIKDIPKSYILEIGIGIAGPLNKNRDLILNPPNIKALTSVVLAKIIEKDLKIKTKMENDAKCFVLAEAIMGAGKGCESILGITLGSGIGGGFLTSNFKLKKDNFEIQKGAFGGAGEIGHMTIKFDGPKCSCGNNGCFEKYASTKFFEAKTNESSLEVEKKARKGEKYAKMLYADFGKNLGIGLANLINILDPEIIVIGGGISKAWPLFLNATKNEIKKRVLSTESKKFVKIKISKLGDFSGAVGAALLVK